MGIIGCHSEMEVDTRTAVSLISPTTFDNFYSEPDKSKIKLISQMLSTYISERITHLRYL